MSDSENLSFLAKNEIRINNIIKNIYVYTNIIPIVICLLSKLHVYNIPDSILYTGIALNLFFTIFISPFSKIDEKFPVQFKYMLASAMQIIIFVYSIDVNIQISVMLMCVPIFCLLYFNPYLVLYSCVISYISMIAGLVLSSHQAGIIIWPGVSPFQYVISLGTSRSLEFIFTSIIFIFSSHLSRKLMYKIHNQEKEISSFQNNIIYSFAEIIESRDGTTGEHIKRTSHIVDLIAKKIIDNPELIDEQKNDAELKLYSLSAPLHDIGKMQIADSILSKPAKLTDEEFEIIKTHSKIGADLIDKTIKNIEKPEFVKIAREMALYHHEKWDGSGYPYNLKEKNIPFSARVMAVADVFDALCSKRSYKQPIPVPEAFKTMDELKNKQFDPSLVEILHSLEYELLMIYKNVD